MKINSLLGLSILALGCAQSAMGDRVILQAAPAVYTNTPSSNAATPGFYFHTNVVFVPRTESPAAGRTNPVVSFYLKPTAIAPPGAAGSGQLKANVLTLHLTQLGPGTYELQAVHGPDGAGEKVGTLTIVDPTVSPDRQATDNKKEASAGPEQVRIDTDVRVNLPATLGQKSISKLMLLDSGGNAVLAGDAQ